MNFSSDRRPARQAGLRRASAALSCAAAAAGLLSGCPPPPSVSFPPVEGLTAESPARVYTPDNLFEYIDGAAESYLAYGFERLDNGVYLKDGESVLTVDIYRHRDDAHAFGVYCQEKPERGDFVPVGTEGYYDKGVLNFFKGRYYVKILDFEPFADERRQLIELARQVAANLDGDAVWPRPLRRLPAANRVPHSERFISRDFLGHSFLGQAFAAEYEIDGETRLAFLLAPGGGGRAREMLDRYREFASARGAEVTETQGIVSFTDPYNGASGVLRLALLDDAVFGMFGVGDEAFRELLREVRAAS